MLGTWGFVSGMSEWMPQLDWQDQDWGQLEVWGFAALNAGNDDNHSQAQMSFILGEHNPSLLSLCNYCFVILWLLGYFPG